MHLFCITIILLFFGNVFATDRLLIDFNRREILLPCKLEAIEVVNYGVERRVCFNPLQVMQPRDSLHKDAVIARVFNKRHNDDAPAAILVQDLTSWTVIDEDPVYITIVDYCLYFDSLYGQVCFAGGCFRNDSAFVLKDVLTKGKTELLYLTSGMDRTGNGEWEPSVNIITYTDYDDDGNGELFVQVTPGRDLEPRALFCIDVEAMKIEWSLPVASVIGQGCLVKCAGETPAVLFTSYGPKNGVTDKYFSDLYGYLTKVGSHGEIIYNKIISNNYGGSRIIPIDDSRRRFCLYLSQPLIDCRDTASLTASESRLVIIDEDAKILNSCSVPGQLIFSWLAEYGKSSKNQIYTTWNDGRLLIYDSTLTLLAESNPTNLGYMLGRIRIKGQKKPIFVMSRTGGVDLYSDEFKKLGGINGLATMMFQALEYDGQGNTTRFVLGGPNCAVIGTIERRTFFELVSIIFWEYHIYILLSLLALSVGIIIVNYRRLRIASKLRVSEEMYRTLVEGAGDSIFSVDYDGRFIFMNEHAAGVLGGKSSELIGKTMWDLFPKEIADRQLKSIREVIDTLKGTIHEEPTEIKGEHRYFRTSIQPLIGVDGNCRSVLAIASDITPVIEAQKLALKERDFTQSLLRTSNSLILCLDGEARITVFNDECERVTGYSRSEVLGKRWPELMLPPAMRHPGLDNFTEWVKAHPSDQMEGQIITKGGEIRDVLWSNSSQFDPVTGELTAIAIGHDITERKRFREALRESEEKYRLLIENATEVITMIDSNHRVTILNKAAANALHGNIEDFIGRKVEELPLGQQAQMMSAIIDNLFASGRSISLEVPYDTKEGRCWYWVNAQPILMSSSPTSFYLFIATDITVRKRNEIRAKARLDLLTRLRTAESVDRCLELGCLAIREAELFKRAVLTLHNEQREIINLGQVGLDPAIVEKARRAKAPSSEMAQRMTQEKYRISYSYFVPEEEGLGVTDLERAIPQEGTHGNSDHAWRPGDELFVPILSAHGNYDGWLSVDTPFNGRRPDADIIIGLEEFVDIVAKKVNELRSLERLNLERQALALANIALRESEERYRNLVDNAIDVIYTLSPDGVITSLNPSFEKATGWKIEEWLGKNFLPIIHPDDAALAQQTTARLLAGESLPMYELRILTKDGSHLNAEFVSSPQIKNGKITGIFGIARDTTDRHQMEEALRQSEAKFRHLAEHSLQGILIATRDRILFANQLFIEMTGYHREQLLNSHPGETIKSLIYPDDLERAIRSFATHVDNPGSPNRYELRILTRGKEYRWYEVYSQGVIFDGLPATHVVLLDIHDRKVAEAALRTSEERFRAQFKNIPLPTYTWQKIDSDYVLTDYNDAAADVTQGGIAKFVGQKLSVMYAHMPQFKIDFDQCINTGRSLHREMEYHYITTNVTKFLSVNYAFVPPDSIMVHTEDITERRLAEQALKYRLEFETLITGISSNFVNMPSAEIDVGIDLALEKIGNFTEVDVSLLFLINDKRTELSIAHIWMSPLVENPPEVRRVFPLESFPWGFGRALRGETIHIPKISALPDDASTEKEALLAHGVKSMVIVPCTFQRELVGALALATLSREQEWPEEIMALLRITGEIFTSAIQKSVTEREIARINAEKVSQAKQIAGGFAHEIRNALFPARGSLSLLKKLICENLVERGHPYNYYCIADEAISRAIDITSLISRYTKLDTERYPEEVDVRAVLNEVISANQMRVGEQKVLVVVNCSDCLKVISNRRQLFMAFNNIFINGLDALEGRDNPTLTIRAFRMEKMCRLTFEDNGVGIDEKDISRIFEAFFSTKPNRGTGLGLATSKKVVELYGGSLIVSSRAGIGTTLTIDLVLAR
jgi:PAS domain S-box-containing protein